MTVVMVMITVRMMMMMMMMDRDACNNGMYAGMSLSDKLQCVGQSEEKFPRQQRIEALHALSTYNKDGLQMGMSSDFILCNILCLSFLPLQHSEAERWRETGSVYSSRQ